MLTRSATLAVIGSALMLGCGVGAERDKLEENQEIVDNLVQAGFPGDDIMIVDGNVYVGRDAHVTLGASREMIERVEAGPEQYRTTNLVGAGVSKICVVTASRFDRYSMLSQGLDLAIQNYNQLGLRVTFVRGAASDCDATITAKAAGGVGGSAGFPAGGMPYDTINIGTGLQNYSVDVNEHVISHELGHCIGFRHSDYYNRSISCGGTAQNEGDAGIGAILIPGTPGTATLGGSVMNSCFRSSETGEWSNSDVTALNALY
jgi:hypothetical protein